jgi:dihydroflavonol-4-reductase
LHCAKILLEKGYTVVGTVRSANKEEEVIKTLKSNSISIKNLSFTHLDLSSDNGWDSAMSNCDYVMHIASPFTVENPKNEEDMLGPAVDGTLRVLKASKNNGIKRVVLTSSTVAIMGGKKTGILKPEDWTDLNSKNISTYFKSKTLAEQAAWDFINNQLGDHSLELVSKSWRGFWASTWNKSFGSFNVDDCKNSSWKNSYGTKHIIPNGRCT